MLFVQDQYQYLITESMRQEKAVISQFANQEFKIKLLNQVQGRKCTVIGSLTAPADQALQLPLLLYTLKQAGAIQVSLFSPYLGYQRQDGLGVDVSYGFRWADAILSASGVTQVTTIEPHCKKSLIGLKVPVIVYGVESLFGQDIAHFVSLGFGFIFPDVGATLRYRWILEKFPTTLQGSFVKRRLDGVVDLQLFQGKASRKVIIYDDILDSGQTLVQVCIALRSMGVEEIVIFVAHAFFHGQAWNDLWSLGVKALYCTNSVPTAHQVDHLQIHQKSIASFL